MSRVGLSRTVIFALACSLVAASAGRSAEPPAVATDQSITPAVAKIVEFARARGMKTLLYSELDDQRGEGNGIISILILSQPRGAPLLVEYQGERSEFMEGLRDEAVASGKNGWRRIAIVVDGEAVTVRREPRAGPIEGLHDRVREAVAGAFPDVPLPPR